MRDRLWYGLVERVKDVRLNGHPEARLPNTLSAGFKGLEAQELLAAILDRVAASAGSACHSCGVEISSVLKAMDIPEEWARGTLRFSTGRMTTEAEITEALSVISRAVARLRKA
jgi:cysteine desulfurase